MRRNYNFSAGPSMLPEEVLLQAKEELMDWRGLGVSIMEISHRSPEFMELTKECEQDFRDLLNISTNYKILFLQGGGRSQFSMVPLNLLGNKKSANYFDTGIWSNLAIKEAQRYCDVNCVASSRDTNYCTIPPKDSWQINDDAAYVYYVDNETVNGVQFPDIPEVNELPLVSDMSSSILSKPIDENRFGLIFAGAQKNIGISGLTVVIIREDLLGHALTITPTMFNYQVHAQENSLYNTSPTFAWYITSLMLKWLKKQGGLSAIAKINARKSQKIYSFIDSCDFYQIDVDPRYRSQMNVVFRLNDDSLTTNFISEAKQTGLINLKGHKLVGGLRASLYNAMPEQGVDTLIQFMTDFAKRYG